MKTINYKIALYIMLFVAAIVFGVNYYFYNEPIKVWFFIDSMSKAVTVITVISLLFGKYFWKSKIFKKWLVKIPNLNGEWKGTIATDWSNNKGKAIEPIKTTLNVKQSLFNISCVMKTKEMASRSLFCGYNIDSDNQLLQLSFTYISTPHQNIQDRSPMHNGTVILDIEDMGKTMKMFGNYWTGRKTTGTIKLEIEKESNK